MVYEILTFFLPLLMIVLWGMPHGAFDLILLSEYKTAFDKKLFFSPALFYLGYIAVAVLAFIGWQLSPTLAFILFLVITVPHFGRADLHHIKFQCANKMEQIAFVTIHGGIALVSIYYFSRDTHLFLNLLDVRSEVIENFFFILLVIGCLLIPSYMNVLFKNKKIYPMLEISIIALMSYLLSSLWALSLYFCFIHSRKHYQKISISLTRLDKKIIQTVLSLMVFVVLAIIGFATFQIREIDLHEATFRSVIAVLFSLTIPHMLLVDVTLPRISSQWYLGRKHA
jgi:Brp/Blh family beta-carotene 15,15'-monooxygenase